MSWRILSLLISIPFHLEMTEIVTSLHPSIPRGLCSMSHNVPHRARTTIVLFIYFFFLNKTSKTFRGLVAIYLGVPYRLVFHSAIGSIALVCIAKMLFEMANNKSNAHLLNRTRSIAIVNRNSATSQHHSADSQRSFSYAIEHHT